MAAELEADGFDVLVTSYSYFEKDSATADRRFLLGREWGVVVFDEAHALKRHDSSRVKRLSRLRAAQRLLMTGTPVQNSIQELLALLSFTLPHVFPPPVVAAFAGESDAGQRAHVPEAQVRRVRQLLAPFILRRTKADVLQQLPPKKEEEAMLRMSPAQQKQYAALLAAAEKARAAAAAGASDQGTGGGGRARRGRSQQAKPEAAAKELQLSRTDAKSLYYDLRKCANHPLLLRRQYSDKQLLDIAKAAQAVGQFGPQATVAMVQAELEENYSDFRLHTLCEELGAKVRLANSHYLPPAIAPFASSHHPRSLLSASRSDSRAQEAGAADEDALRLGQDGQARAAAAAAAARRPPRPALLAVHVDARPARALHRRGRGRARPQVPAPRRVDPAGAAAGPLAPATSPPPPRPTSVPPACPSSPAPARERTPSRCRR